MGNLAVNADNKAVICAVKGVEIIVDKQMTCTDPKVGAHPAHPRTRSHLPPLALHEHPYAHPPLPPAPTSLHLLCTSTATLCELQLLCMRASCCA